MPAISLPDEPSLEQLRNQAKDLRDESGGPLWEAQLAVARRYGFTSWTRLKRQVDSELSVPPRTSFVGSSAASCDLTGRPCDEPAKNV